MLDREKLKMNHKILIVGFLTVAFLFLLETQANAQTNELCVKTGDRATKVKVFKTASTKSTVLRMLKEGTRVQVADVPEDENLGEEAANMTKIGDGGRRSGWVVSRYLKKCRGQRPKSLSSMNIKGSVRKSARYKVRHFFVLSDKC